MGGKTTVLILLNLFLVIVSLDEEKTEMKSLLYSGEWIILPFYLKTNEMFDYYCLSSSHTDSTVSWLSLAIYPW